MARKIPDLEDLDVPAWFLGAAEELRSRVPKWRKSLRELGLRDGTVLPAEAEGWIHAALIHSEKEAIRHDLVDLLRRHALPAELDAWLVEVLEAWLAAGAPEKDEWILTGAGQLGGDGCVEFMSATAYRWVREKNQRGALRLVDALGRIGTKRALAEVAMLSAVSRDHKVADDAAATVARRASAAGLSAPQLSEQHLPTFDLDARGELWLDYGPRQFRVRLQPDLSLVLLDASGTRRRSLPPAARTDDAALVQAAKARWSALRLAIPRAVRAQLRRFEQGMLAGRRWSLGELRAMLPHPLLGRLVRLLVWQDASTGQTLRLAEDGQPADAEERGLALPEATALRLVHPLQLDHQVLAAWREIFADYGLVQPFPQLQRSVHRCEPRLRNLCELPAPPHPPLDPGMLYGVLDNEGWQVAYLPGGGVERARRVFGPEQVTVYLQLASHLPTAQHDGLRQSVEFAWFVAGTAGDEQLMAREPMKLGAVPALPFSEVQRRLQRLAAKGNEL